MWEFPKALYQIYPLHTWDYLMGWFFITQLTFMAIHIAIIQ